MLVLLEALGSHVYVTTPEASNVALAPVHSAVDVADAEIPVPL
jgi:hypothetical protein